MKNMSLIVIAALLALILAQAPISIPHAGAQTPIYDLKVAPSSACSQGIVNSVNPGATEPFAQAPPPAPAGQAYIPHLQDFYGITPHAQWEAGLVYPGTFFYCPIIRDNVADVNALKEVIVHVVDSGSTTEIGCDVFELSPNPNVPNALQNIGHGGSGIAFAAGYKKITIPITSSRVGNSTVLACTLGTGTTLSAYAWRELGPSDSK